MPDKGIILSKQLDEACGNITDFLKSYHKKFPLRQGLKQSGLKVKLFKKIEPALFDKILSRLINDELIEIKNETVYLSGHTIGFSPGQEKIKIKIEEIYLQNKYITPSREEIFKQSSIKKDVIEDVITGMTELGILIEIKSGTEKPVIFHSKYIEEAENLLVDFLRKNDEIKLSEFREIINSSRKYALPLLIFFDNKGITERVGDVRKLLSLKRN